MGQFACVNCGAMVVTDLSVGEMVVCQNCNTRQAVPRVIAETVSSSRIVPHTPFPDKATAGQGGKIAAAAPPRYQLVWLGGWIMMVGGGISVAMALSNLFARQSDSGSLINGFVGGLGIMGIGQLLHCVRDIAKNTWRDTTR